MEERSLKLWSSTCPRSIKFSTNSILVCSIQWFSWTASWNCFWFRFLMKICKPCIFWIWLCSRIWASSDNFEWVWVGIGIGLCEKGLDRGIVGRGGVEVGGRLEVLCGGGGGIRSLGGGLRLVYRSTFISAAEGIKGETQLNLMCGACRVVIWSHVCVSLKNWVKKSDDFPFVLNCFGRGNDEFRQFL